MGAESPSQRSQKEKNPVGRAAAGIKTRTGSFNAAVQERRHVTNDVRNGIIKLLPRLRRFAYALAADPDKGDDLVQEACARAFGRLDQWRAGTRLDSWMYKIIRNIWLDQKRASRVCGVIMNLDDELHLVGEDGRDVIESRLTLNRVLEAMVKLPEEQRAPIVLVCFEGLSYQEAAAILEIPVGTVTSRLVRGRRALHAMVEGVNAMEDEHDKAN
jgi:RNA polymerase sigma-70 factor (ECF subfamily)